MPFVVERGNPEKGITPEKSIANSLPHTEPLSEKTLNTSRLQG